MSVIHTYLPRLELKHLSLRDNDYLRHKITVTSALNNLLHKPINKTVLSELQCILDSKSIARQKTEQHERNGRVSVYNADGKLIRIEHANGKVMKEI